MSEESAYANAIAHYIGYDPRVVYAWAQLETGGQAIGHNWLNLRPYHTNQGGPTDDVGVVGVSPGGFDVFSSVSAAAISAEHRLQHPFASGIRAAGGPGHSPAQEIAALAASDWDAGHYGGEGGPSIANVFAGLYGRSELGQPASSHVVKDSGKQTSSSTLDKLTGVPGSGGIGGLTDGVAAAIEKWAVRGALIVVGTGLALLGLYFIARAMGASPVAPLERASNFATRGLVAKRDNRAKENAQIAREARRYDNNTARKQEKERKRAEREKQRELDGYGDVPY